jgi:hypothetical protein
MILASHGLIASSISGVDADWLAYYNRVIAAGGSLTTTEQNATKQLVADLKANSLWTPMKAIYPMVGASAAACAQNLKSASFAGTFNGGWTFASTGVKGNGTNNYMETFLNPTTTLPTNVNIGFYGRTTFTGGSTYPLAWGCSGAVAYYLGGDQYQDSYLGNTALIQNKSGYLGFFQRSGALGVQNRRLGTISKGTNSNNYTPAITNILLGFNNSDTTNSEIAFFSIGDYITTTQQDIFYNLVQSFQTTLSRNV